MVSEGRKFLPMTEFQRRIPPPSSVAADLDGTLLASSSSFPYFLLLSFKAGGRLRSLILILFAPLVLALYKLVSESAAIRVLIFISVAGLRMDSVMSTAASVLPELYAGNVRADAWAVFSSCSHRRVVVTANPRIMIEPFARECLGACTVLGTELEIGRSGRLTGFIAGGGVLVGKLKRMAVLREFEDEQPDVGLGDRSSDHDFMALCREAYMVPKFTKSDSRVDSADLAWTEKNQNHQSRCLFRDLPIVIKFLIKATLNKN